MYSTQYSIVYWYQLSSLSKPWTKLFFLISFLPDLDFLLYPENNIVLFALFEKAVRRDLRFRPIFRPLAIKLFALSLIFKPFCPSPSKVWEIKGWRGGGNLYNHFSLFPPYCLAVNHVLGGSTCPHLTLPLDSPNYSAVCYFLFLGLCAIAIYVGYLPQP